MDGDDAAFSAEHETGRNEDSGWLAYRAGSSLAGCRMRRRADRDPGGQRPEHGYRRHIASNLIEAARKQSGFGGLDVQFSYEGDAEKLPIRLELSMS